MNNNVDQLIKLLKENKIDPTLDDNDAIRTASILGLENVVKVLLEDGRADPAAQDS